MHCLHRLTVIATWDTSLDRVARCREAVLCQINVDTSCVASGAGHSVAHNARLVELGINLARNAPVQRPFQFDYHTLKKVIYRHPCVPRVGGWALPGLFVCPDWVVEAYSKESINKQNNKYHKVFKYYNIEIQLMGHFY